MKCFMCGKFCKIWDEETPYGCKVYDPPEPYDSEIYCKPCSKILKQDWFKRFKNGWNTGCWIKSFAEKEAAEECKLIWIGSNGIGNIRKKEWKMNIYVTEKEYKKLNKK